MALGKNAGKMSALPRATARLEMGAALIRFLGVVGGAVIEGAGDWAQGYEVDGDWAVVGGAGFGGGANDFPLAAEAGDDAALGRDFLLTTHVDHNFFGFVLIVE